MLNIVAAVLLGQCYIIDGKMICPLPQKSTATAPLIPAIKLKPVPKPKKVQPQPTLSFGSYEKWY